MLRNKKLTNLIWVYEVTLTIVGGGSDDGGGGDDVDDVSGILVTGGAMGRVLRLHRTRQHAFQFERPILARIRFAVTADAV